MSKYHNKNSKKLNCVLDLDNSIISSLSLKEIMELKNIDSRKLNHKTMEGYYRVYERPYLEDFLQYIFEHFEVSVWTAASKDYASFILNNFILKGNKSRRIKMFLYDENCEESQKLYNKNSPKDLRYIYNFKGYHPCNTLIIDDLSDVFKANPKQTIRAPYFDAKKKSSETDTFLVDVVKKLQELKSNYETKGCMFHKD